MGVLKDLVQQTSDAINKMSIAVNGLKLGMQNQQDAAATRDQQLSGQIQSLNDSMDELKVRMTHMETALGSIQSQQQSANAMLTNLPQVGGGIPAGTPASTPAGPAATTPTTAQENQQEAQRRMQAQAIERQHRPLRICRLPGQHLRHLHRHR